MMSKGQMDKRKPERASKNFWGKWDDEMYLKTLARHVYSPKFIPRDPMKIDDSYQNMKLREARIAELEAAAIVRENANGEVIDTTPDTSALDTSTVPGLPESRSVSIPIDVSTGEVTTQPDLVLETVSHTEQSAPSSTWSVSQPVSVQAASAGGGAVPETTGSDEPNF